MSHRGNGHFPWERTTKMTAAHYARDLKATRELPYDEKFAGLLRLCAEVKQGKFQIIVVTSPEILGDDYDELVHNLKQCAQVGLLVAFSEQKAV
jgi:hypothetical protein